MEDIYKHASTEYVYKHASMKDIYKQAFKKSLHIHTRDWNCIICSHVSLYLKHKKKMHIATVSSQVQGV